MKLNSQDKIHNDSESKIRQIIYNFLPESDKSCSKYKPIHEVNFSGLTPLIRALEFEMGTKMETVSDSVNSDEQCWHQLWRKFSSDFTTSRFVEKELLPFVFANRSFGSASEAVNRLDIGATKTDSTSRSSRLNLLSAWVSAQELPGYAEHEKTIACEMDTVIATLFRNLPDRRVVSCSDAFKATLVGWRRS